MSSLSIERLNHPNKIIGVLIKIIFWNIWLVFTQKINWKISFICSIQALRLRAFIGDSHSQIPVLGWIERRCSSDLLSQTSNFESSWSLNQPQFLLSWMHYGPIKTLLLFYHNNLSVLQIGQMSWSLHTSTSPYIFLTPYRDTSTIMGWLAESCIYWLLGKRLIFEYCCSLFDFWCCYLFLE